MPERGKNLPVRILTNGAKSLINSELKIARMELKHPERLATPTDPQPAAPLAQWDGTLSQLLEIIVVLSLTGLVRTPDGRPMNLMEVATLFETMFGVEIGDLYGRKTRLLTRKKNESPFLESLLFLYRKEVEKVSL